MKKDESRVSVEALDSPPPSSIQQTLSPTEDMYQYARSQGYHMKLTYVEAINSWVGDGYVLNDKPLLKVTYERD
jgi:hypothetical protein